MKDTQIGKQPSFFSKKQRQQLKTFQEKLLEKNQQINLLSRKKINTQADKLFKEAEDSVQLLKNFFTKRNQKILDIGSGNGFPGLFFAISFPYNQFYLCERKRNKAEAIKWISFQCQLSNIQVLCQPAESLKPDYDFLLSQASMPPHQIKKLLKPFLEQKATAFLWVSERQISSFHSAFYMEQFPLSHQSHQKKVILKLKDRSS